MEDGGGFVGDRAGGGGEINDNFFRVSFGAGLGILVLLGEIKSQEGDDYEKKEGEKRESFRHVF